MNTTLQFFGDWSVWLGLPVALLGALTVWYFYRREVKQRTDILRWFLPLLRSTAVFFLILMLTGPVIHHRETIGQFARILLYVDASRSMSVGDSHMPAGRKLLAAARLGWMPEELLPQDLNDFELSLIEAQQSTASGVRYAPNNPSALRTATDEALKASETAFEKLKTLSPEMLTGLAPRGSARLDYWENIRDGRIYILKRAKGFPEKPDGSLTVTMLEGRKNWKEKYGTKISGYLYPPASGRYTFFLIANDEAELYLSDDDNHEKPQKVLSAKSDEPTYDWSSSKVERSSPIQLESGKRYYFEILTADRNGDDYMALGWQMPDGRMERPIPGNRVSPWQPELEKDADEEPVVYLDFKRSLLEPLAQLRRMDPVADTAGYHQKLKAIDSNLSDWLARVRTAYEPWGQDMVEARLPEAMKAISDFDSMNRWQRIESIMFSGGSPLLTQLAQDHNVELITVSGEDLESVWQAQAQKVIEVESLPESFERLPASPFTNLYTPIQKTISRSDSDPSNAEEEEKGKTEEVPEEQIVGILFTDGRHNLGDSPKKIAEIAGGRNIPIYTVGIGSEQTFSDMAILSVDMPEKISIKDRATGVIRIKSGLTAGNTFKISLTTGGETAWTKTEKTSGEGLQEIKFSFPVEPLVDKMKKSESDELRRESFPLEFTARIAPPAGMDMLEENNTMNVPTQVSSGKQKVLIIDGRGRWEYRYIRNLFNRDEKWEVTAVLPEYRRGQSPKYERGDQDDQLPDSREALMAYSLIILGDVDPLLFSSAEITWLNDFVMKSGGGLILIDGQRGYLERFSRSDLKDLIPIKWQGGSGPATGLRLTEKGQLMLTERGKNVDALSLKGDQEENVKIWSGFEPPHWAAKVQAKPTAEVLVEVTIDGKKTPGIVQMRYGKGQVYYQAFSESWRWRKRVGGQYHDPYWNQVARLVMPPPFAVSDAVSSLDTGGVVYKPDEKIQIRAQLRDSKTGQPVVAPGLNAVIRKDGLIVSNIPLEADQERLQYFGSVSGLDRGEYKVTLSAKNFDGDAPSVETIFHVVTPGNTEMAELSCNFQTLKEISDESGAEYLSEEEAMLLPARLKPLSQGKVIETDTVLWQHYIWLAWIVLLLAVEAILRKRSGLL